MGVGGGGGGGRKRGWRGTPAYCVVRCVDTSVAVAQFAPPGLVRPGRGRGCTPGGTDGGILVWFVGATRGCATPTSSDVVLQQGKGLVFYWPYRNIPCEMETREDSVGFRSHAEQNYGMSYGQAPSAVRRRGF